MRRVLPEFFRGVATLGRGFAFWRVRPGLMLLGLLPAVIVGALLVTGLVLLGVFLPQLVAFATPFADGWDPGWRDTLRVLVAVAVVVGVLALAARTFTAVTLLVGTPFYDRIQLAADGEVAELPEPGFWRMTGATTVLVLRSLLASILVVAVGFIPVVGSVLATVLGFCLTAAALTRELTLNPLSRRGLDGPGRSRALHTSRARSFGFGVAVQACFLVPFGAIIAMPAAVAGSALLTRDLLGETRTPGDPS